jgi:hypothetical protein
MNKYRKYSIVCLMAAAVMAGCLLLFCSQTANALCPVGAKECGWNPRITIAPLCDKCDEIAAEKCAIGSGYYVWNESGCGTYYTGLYIPFLGCGTWIMDGLCDGPAVWEC